MRPVVLAHLKRTLSNGLESLPNGSSGHRTISYDGTDYFVRTLAAHPPTIARLMELGRSDHHLPEIVTLADRSYEIQELLPNPTLDVAPLRTLDEAHATYERVWNAIGACHEVGVGHGDVHPNNILYRGGEIAIIDWEWARERDRPSRIPRLDLTHYDYAGLTYTGRALFMNHPDATGIFPQDLRSLGNTEALERTISKISEDLKLRPLA